MENKHEAAKDKDRKEEAVRRAHRTAADPAADHRLLLLQQQAGNRAVQELLHSHGVQAKLAVSDSGDMQERHADQVADRVMRAHAGFPSAANGACAAEDESCGPTTAQPSHIQRSAGGGKARSDGVETVSAFLRQESGEPLDAAMRSFFEPRFARDFSNVRLHTGANAAGSAKAIQALAYTAGHDIVFDASRIAPTSPTGRHVLAHELVHVVQQGSAPCSRVQRIVEVRPPGPGEGSAFDRRQELVDRMNALSTGVTYALSGRQFAYTVTDVSKATAFDRQMEALIDRTEVVPMRLITSADRVGSRATGFSPLLIDSFQAGYLDMDDMRASDDNSFKMNLLHLLTERFAVRDYARRIGTNFSNAEFDRAHAAGLQSETQYLRETIGDPTIRFVFEETKADGTLVFGYRSAEGYSIFHVFLRAAQAVSGGHVWAQTRDNRHISIDNLIAERAAALAGAGVGP